jgi:hypothetical protein
MSSQIRGAARAASRRLAAHFEANQGTPISRDTVADLADEQKDPLKRVRRNGGARDYLDPKGIAILWGKGDRKVIKQLGLGPVADDEFIAYKPKSQSEFDIIRSGSHKKLQSPGF